MTTIDRFGYVRKKTSHKNGTQGIAVYQNWFFVKHSYHSNSKSGMVSLRDVLLPEHLLGKRVRFRLEIIKDEEEE